MTKAHVLSAAERREMARLTSLRAAPPGSKFRPLAAPVLPSAKQAAQLAKLARRRPTQRPALSPIHALLDEGASTPVPAPACARNAWG